MKKTIKDSDLDELIQELIRKHGATKVIESIISSCDASADFAHSCNDKQTENYWREVAVKIFDVVKRIQNILPPAKKY
jgi:hypothetical protein